MELQDDLIFVQMGPFDFFSDRFTCPNAAE
jgi:hypothetical protein